MKIQLPCKLGERFTIHRPGHYRHGEYILVGFYRGMRQRDGYTDLDYCAYKNSETNIDYLSRRDFQTMRTAAHLPGRVFELHPIAEHGIKSSLQAELMGVLYLEGVAMFDFVYPTDYYRHTQHSCKDLEQHIAPLLSGNIIHERIPRWVHNKEEYR